MKTGDLTKCVWDQENSCYEPIYTDRGKYLLGKPDKLGHITRISDSSFYDERCKLCGATDCFGDSRLTRECSARI